MRQLTDNFIEANAALAREPRFVAKILNDYQTLYITSSPDVSITDPGSAIFSGAMTDLSGSSQNIEPERGFSTIGSMTIQVDDIGFTTKLREIADNGDTIYNNQVILYAGFKDLAFADYVKIMPLYVAGNDNNELTYTITLKDTQRFSDQAIFTDKPKAICVGSLGYSTGSLEVSSTTGFSMVEHDADWTDSPSATVGYLKVRGVNRRGQDVTEYMRYTATTSTTFTISERGLFGTEIIDLKGTNDSGTAEVEELVHLDLNVPKLLIALLTGDLYGQPGKTLPSHWHAGLTASQIDLASFENIGDDLWNFNLDFLDLDDEDAKRWIADQVLRINNLFLYVNQDGELALDRFAVRPQDAPGSKVLNYDSIVDIGGITRDSNSIRNNFLISWEYRADREFFGRHDVYIDAASVSKNNITSKQYQLKLYGLRNKDRNSKVTLDRLADGIRARFSNPRVRFNATVLLRDAIELEVGDSVTLDLPNQPDYESLDTLFATFEIQGISYDFMGGLATLDLYGSSGSVAPLSLSAAGSDVAAINHTGWTDISTVLTGSVVGSTFTITSSGNLPEGKYYYDGNIQTAAGVTVTFNGTTWVDCADFDLVDTAIWDGSARGGTTGAQGYFGGGDAAQEGVYSGFGGFLGLDRYYKRRTRLAGTDIPASRTSVDSYSVRVDTSNNLVGVPTDLTGNGGSAGRESTFKYDVFSGFTAVTGGAATTGGAGLNLFCENLFFDANSKIITSGEDANVGNDLPSDGGMQWSGGTSGFGWPGALICFMKVRSNPAPLLENVHVAKTGTFTEPFTVDHRPKSDGSRRYSTPDNDNYAPIYPANAAYADTQWNSSHAVYYIAQDETATATEGVTYTPNAKLPTIALAEQVNTPRSPLGNQSTITVTATPVGGDTAYSYSIFEYRLQGQDAWTPIEYGIGSESTVRVTSDGSTYEFSATPVNTQGVPSNARTTDTITVSNVSIVVGETDSDSVDLTIPEIKRLELVNRINDGEGWNQWKGPHAIFRWAKLSVTNGGNIITPTGRLDLHLAGYKVRITNTNTGLILREETVEDSTYTYTLEKNRKDTNGSPTRNIRVDVQALATTGKLSTLTGFNCSNPQPDAVTGVTVTPGFASLTVTYTLPTDLDFVGVDAYVIADPGDPLDAEPIRVLGNSFTLDQLTSGATYNIKLTSVDQFGTGSTTATVSVATIKIGAEDIGDITDALTLDENGGRIVTNNSGYIAVMGAVTRAGVSANPLIFHTWNGSEAPYWTDTAGNFGYGTGDQTLSFDGTSLNFGTGVTIGSNANRTVTVDTSGADYTTVNAALVALSKTVPAYTSGGFTATIEIQSGYTIAENINIVGLNLGWISLTAVDTNVSIDHTGASGFWMRLDNATGPSINFDVTLEDGGDFIYATNGSKIRLNIDNIDPGSGYAGGITDYLFYADNGSVIDIEPIIDVSGLGSNIFTAVDGSQIYCRTATTTGCRQTADCQDNSYMDLGGLICADFSTTVCCYAYRLSRIDMSGSAITNIATRSATYYPVNATRMAEIIFTSSTFTDSSGYAKIRSYESSKIHMNSATINGDIQCDNGSHINAISATATNINVTNGSTIAANSSTGTLSQTANTLTASGIIFK